MRLRLHSPEISGETIELAATLEGRDKSERLWWRVPRTHEAMVTRFADPFVIGLSFQMMKAGEDVEVEGPVSESLLASLEKYMDIWACWVPKSYRRVRVWSREEGEPSTPSSDTFVMPFSAGVDSCYTALTHARGLAGRNTMPIGLGVTMFGFDIRPEQLNAQPMYAHLVQNAKSMLASLNIPHVEISTNFRSLSSLWMHSHGSHLASGLSLFGGGFRGALIPNSLLVNHLDVLWGSHPLSDPFLSSRHFQIIDDGGAVARWRKIGALLDWPEAMAGLRVCFGVDGSTGNCGKCEKCIRTAIAFLINDATPTAGLPTTLTAKDIRRVKVKQPIAISFWEELLDGIALRDKHAEPWAAGVRTVMRRVRRHQFGRAVKQPFLPLRAKIREIFRGSTLSKKELAAQRIVQRPERGAEPANTRS